MNKKEDIVLKLIVFVLFISFIFSIINVFLHAGYRSLFWLCYTAMLIIGFGIIKKKSYLILSQIIILLIPDILWMIDFFTILFTGNSLMNLSSYFFTDRPLISKLVSSQHLYVMPLALYALYVFKIHKPKLAIKFASLQLIIFFIIVRLFTPEKDNINCAYYLCFDLQPLNYINGIIPYNIGWFLIMFAQMMVVYFILNKLKVFKK